MATYVVTGGAGFIGSNIVARLAARGDDVIVVDSLCATGSGSGDKWRNLAACRLLDLVPPGQAMEAIAASGARIAAVLHMGAISSTTETDVDLIVENNFRWSCRWWEWCSAQRVPLVYASSAATYGDGACGFEDRETADYLERLRPLNAYGWSKHLFDRWVTHRCGAGKSRPPHWAGVKFFNVYGPNEEHKGAQRSTALQIYEQIVAGQRVALFQSHRPDYRDGEQKRDFVWVGDCVDAVLWLAASTHVSGIFNVGSGCARSFADLARAVFQTLGHQPAIDYVPMPETLRLKYQYLTCADVTKLQSVGCPFTPLSLEAGVRRYVEHLATGAKPG